MSMAPDLEMQPIVETSSVEQPKAPKIEEPIQEESNDADQDIHEWAATAEKHPPHNLSGPQAAGRPGMSAKKTFGIKQTSMRTPPAYDPVAATYDYTVKYKDDPFGHELDENARVWHVYNDEAREFDAELIEETSDSLDILLVFAGLFSAVLTTFVVQTSQALSTDNAAITVSLLKELVDLQRAQATGVSVNTVASAVTTSSPSRINKWVNGLWFISLTLSLSDALVAVLAKQWLRQYHSRLSGNPKERTIWRQFRYDGFERWGVRSFIGFLPIILHFSLILFLIGLVLFLIPLNAALASVIGSITIILLGIYILTNLLPLASIQCPYRTPLTNLLWRLFIGLGLRLRPFLSWAPLRIRQYLDIVARDRFKHLDLNYRESQAAFSWGLGLGAPKALLSLWDTTTNASARRIVTYSLPSLPINTVQSLDHEGDAYRQVLGTALQDCVHSAFAIEGLEGSIAANFCDITEADKVGVRRTLLCMSTLRLQPQLWDTIFGRPYVIFPSTCQVPPSDLDLVLMALAASADRIKFSVVGDENNSLSPVDLHCKDALSWVLEHHQSIDMPALPLAIWQSLWERGGWDLDSFELLGMFEACMQQCEINWSPTALKAQMGCGIISLQEFLQVRYAPRVSLQMYSIDWIAGASPE